jgi:WXG100 family type VII secretion target
MTDRTQVVHGAVQTASSDLGRKADEIQQVLDTLEGEINKLMGRWDGQAKEAYRVAQGQWSGGMTDLRGLLAEISALLQQTSEGFGSVDNQWAGRISG